MHTSTMTLDQARQHLRDLPSNSQRTKLIRSLGLRGEGDGLDRLCERAAHVLAGMADPGPCVSLSDRITADIAAAHAAEQEHAQTQTALLAAIAARAGWSVEHVSTSGSIYAKHEATGAVVRISDHYVPEGDAVTVRRVWDKEIVYRRFTKAMLVDFTAAAESIEAEAE